MGQMVSTGAQLSRSLQQYLGAVYILEGERRVARVKDIAGYLGVQMPSVTGAIKSLKQKGLIGQEKNSFITLTPEGRRVAQQLQRVHSVLQCFLENVLMVETEKAEQFAYNMECALDTETAERLCNSIKYFTTELSAKQQVSREEWIQILKSQRTPCTICRPWPDT